MSDTGGPDIAGFHEEKTEAESGEESAQNFHMFGRKEQGYGGEREQMELTGIEIQEIRRPNGTQKISAPEEFFGDGDHDTGSEEMDDELEPAGYGWGVGLFGDCRIGFRTQFTEGAHAPSLVQVGEGRTEIAKPVCLRDDPNGKDADTDEERGEDVFALQRNVVTPRAQKQDGESGEDGFQRIQLRIAQKRDGLDFFGGCIGGEVHHRTDEHDTDPQDEWRSMSKGGFVHVLCFRAIFGGRGW